MKPILHLFLLSCAVAAMATAPHGASELFREAQRLDDADSLDIALTIYLKADSAFVAENLCDSPDYALSLHLTGRALLSSGRYPEGRDYTFRAAKLREKLFGKVSRDYITSLNNYGLSYLFEDNPKEAVKYLEEVVNLCKKLSPSHPNEGQYMVSLGRAYHALANDKEAVKLMEEALPRVEKFSSDYEYVLNFLGSAYMEAGDNANVNHILGLMDEHNRHELEKECNDPQCHLARAEYYMSTGDHARAKDEYMAVFDLPLSDSEKALAYEKYAHFLFNQNDVAQAAEYYALASEALENTQAPGEKSTSLLHHAALCYFVGKEFSKSMEAHAGVIARTDRYNLPGKLKSSSLQGIGNAYSALKDYGNAADAYRRWTEYLGDSGRQNDADYAKAYERLASAEKFNGDYDASLADYDMAIELYGRLGMYDEQQQTINGKKMCLAYARRDMGDVGESEAASAQRNGKIRITLKESLDALEQGGEYLGKLHTARSLGTVAGCYARLGDYNNAAEYYSQYIPALREALTEDFLLKTPKERELTWKRELDNIREMNAMIASVPNNPELYSRMSSLIYEGQLLSKGILLSSEVEFDKVLERYGTKQMKAQYAEIKKNLNTISKMKEGHEPTDDILALIRKTDAMQLALARESAEYDDFMNYLRISSADVLQAIGDDAAAIEFVTLDTDILSDHDMVAAAILSNEYPSGIVIPLALVKDIREMIEADDKFADSKYGEAFWSNILQAIGDKKKIFMAPDGLLNNIGIEYLMVGDKPLSEQYEISRLTSTRETTRRHVPASIRIASLFGGIDYLGEGVRASDKQAYAADRAYSGPVFAYLENTRKEVDEIYGILNRHTEKTFEYSSTKASKEEFLSQDKIGSLGLLHIATHGKYTDPGKTDDLDAMDHSILAFAGASLNPNLKENAGIVTASEIARMSLHDCELVVLSACESGLGKLGNDGVFGLQRGFKNAGVKSMIVSLCEVADESTADMMIEFYRNLFAAPGISKREAFRKAQSKIRGKYPDDPTWASFILIDSFN